MPGPAFRRGEDVSLHTVEEDDLAVLQRLRNDPAFRARTAATVPENMDELTEWFEEDVSALEGEAAQFLVVPTEAEPTGTSTSPAAGEGDGAGAASGDDDPERTSGDDTGATPGDGDTEAAADRQPDPVGFVALSGVERPAGRGEICCTVDLPGRDVPAERRSRYAREALELLVGYAVEERRLHRVVARAPAGDEAYRGALESVGFTAELTQREEWLVDGEHVDVVCHAVLADEWGGA